MAHSNSPKATPAATLSTNEVIPAGTSFGYTFIVDGQEWWYDGFNWAHADGTFLQSLDALFWSGL